MSTWKVILATLVIFTAGLFTGGALIHRLGPRPLPFRGERPPGQGPPLPMEMRAEYVQRLQKELSLSPEQGREVSRIVAESQERVQAIFERIGPEMRQEMQQVAEAIRKILSPAQQQQFDEMRRYRRGRPGERPSDGRRFRFRGPPYLEEPDPLGPLPPLPRDPPSPPPPTNTPP